MFQRFFLFISLLCVPAVAAAQPAYTDYYWGGYLGGVASADAEGESANFFDPSKSFRFKSNCNILFRMFPGSGLIKYMPELLASISAPWRR